MKLTANLEDRTITGLALPFNEVGRTSLGGITASAESAIAFDSDMTLNYEHDGKRPLGRIVGLPETTPEGVVATFKVANTTAGNDLLAEVHEGLRTGLSVELDDPVIRSGRLLSGTLTAVAAVTKPAYASARVLTAADAGELPEDATDDVREALVKALEVIDANTTKNDDNTEDGNEVTDENTTGALTASDNVARVSQLNAVTNRDKDANTLTAAEAFKAIANGIKTSRLEAALANVTHDDGDNDGDGLGEIAASPEWLGEVYRKAPYQRKFVPLVAQGNITNWRMTGFKYATTPTVQTYAGNKAEIPSQGITAEPYSLIPKRWAVGADIDRRFVDFGDQAVIQAWFEFAANSYKKVTDEDLRDFLVANATDTTAGTVPVGVDPGVAAIADAALALVADDLNPTFAVVGADLYRNILLTPKDKVTEFLGETAGFREGGLAGFRIIPSADPALESQVLVADGSTVRFREFGGGSPLRVEAEHLSHGGRDVAVFGYSANEVLEDGGVRIVDLTAP